MHAGMTILLSKQGTDNNSSPCLHYWVKSPIPHPNTIHLFQTFYISTCVIIKSTSPLVQNKTNQNAITPYGKTHTLYVHRHTHTHIPGPAFLVIFVSSCRAIEKNIAWRWRKPSEHAVKARRVPSCRSRWSHGRSGTDVECFQIIARCTPEI